MGGGEELLAPPETPPVPFLTTSRPMLRFLASMAVMHSLRQASSNSCRIALGLPLPLPLLLPPPCWLYMRNVMSLTICRRRGLSCRLPRVPVQLHVTRSSLEKSSAARLAAKLPRCFAFRMHLVF